MAIFRVLYDADNLVIFFHETEKCGSFFTVHKSAIFFFSHIANTFTNGVYLSSFGGGNVHLRNNKGKT